MPAINERRLVRKAIILPRVAIAALGAVFLTGLLTIALAVIDGVFLESDSLPLDQVIAAGIVMAACGVVCIVSFFTAKRAVRNLDHARLDPPDASAAEIAALGGMAISGAGRIAQSSDNPIVDAAGNAAEIGGMAVSTVGITRMLSATGKQADRAAASLDQPSPSARPYVIATLAIPCLLVVALFVPRFVDTAQANEANRIAATETVIAVRDALETGCETVRADDPLENRSKSGYRVHGLLHDYRADENARVIVDIDSKGVVREVSYTIDVDITRSAQANLERANHDIATLSGLLSTTNAEAMADELLTAPSVPDEFVTRVERDSYFQEFSLDIEETGDLSVWMAFSTDERENFDENSKPAIHLYLESNEHR